MEIPKRLEELVLAEANLEKDAIEAYRRGDFAASIRMMSKLLDRDKNNWHARLYLAMSHYSAGDVYLGSVHFRFLQDNCPEPAIRLKADCALHAMETQARNSQQSGAC